LNISEGNGRGDESGTENQLVQNVLMLTPVAMKCENVPEAVSVHAVSSNYEHEYE
jgi:hypothetical protein